MMAIAWNEMKDFLLKTKLHTIYKWCQQKEDVVEVFKDEVEDLVEK